MAAIDAFRDQLYDDGIVDSDGIHHELQGGFHGIKVDFDKIQTGTELYDDWVDLTAEAVDALPEMPDVLVGVANGTNRLALDVARQFGGNVLGLVSEKTDTGLIRLNCMARMVIYSMKSKVVVLEDVGKSGFNASQVAMDARGRGAFSVQVLNTWQRRARLVELDDRCIPHSALIMELLPDYTPEDCRKEGPCSKGAKLIKRKAA